MKRIFLILGLACVLSLTAFAQCGIENTAFKSGESLTYDLYFNWKFIWMKVRHSISARVPVKATVITWTRYGTAILTGIVS